MSKGVCPEPREACEKAREAARAMKESAVEILKPIEGIEVLATGTPAWYRGMRPG